VKGDAYTCYSVHGDSIDSLAEGFIALGMPASRRSAASQIVREVLKVNNVTVFRWYKTEGTNELSCYWDDAKVNMLWVTSTDVHIERDTRRPERAHDWDKQDGKYIGWLLPGAERGTGGGRRASEVATVLCPESFIRQPLGSTCPTCDAIHEMVE
jgi:hypothetical protein